MDPKEQDELEKWAEANGITLENWTKTARISYTPPKTKCARKFTIYEVFLMRVKGLKEGEVPEKEFFPSPPDPEPTPRDPGHIASVIYTDDNDKDLQPGG